MKKTVTVAISFFVLLVGFYFGYIYYNGPKIVDGVVSKNIDSNGKPIELTTEFAPGDTIYFSAKVNRFWIKRADVIWYNGEIETENRFLVEENIKVNNGGYFSAKLTVPEGLEEGHYGVTIYRSGNDIIETRAEFDVKK